MGITDFSLTLKWHPRFLAVTSYPDQCFLLSENDPLFLTGSQYEPLIRGIETAQPIETILNSRSHISQQATLLYLMETGLQQGLWVTSDFEEDLAYYRPNVSSVPLKLETSERRGWILSDYADEAFWKKHLQALPLSISIPIVVVDDYLDTRLVQINHDYCEQQQSWLLIQATGEQPRLGPYFTPHVPQNPCWHCLASRLWNNQPVRRWWQGQSADTPATLPILFDAPRIQSFFETIIQQLALWEELPANQMWIWEDSKPALSVHPVQHRPQCESCGQSNLIVSQQTQPWFWEETPKTNTDDGGFRSCSPQATLQAAQTVIDPVTGVVSDLRPLPSQQEGGLVTYRSVFFKVPQRVSSDQPLGPQDFIQVSLGKGVSDDQSQASALAESIERYASQYQGDEQKQKALPSELTSRKVLPHQLTIFSETQYQQFQANHEQPNEPNHAVEPYPENQPLHWIPSWSFTYQDWCQVPFTYCYANTPLEDERFIRFFSNGCSAGNTLEEAALQGFLEVIERDATAIWWYNRAVRPQVDLSVLPDDAQTRVAKSLGQEWDYWVLDLTHDLQIPVMAAVGQHRENQTFCLGFGCHLDAKLACLRALTELCQLVSIDNKFSGKFDFRKIPAEPYLFPDPNSSKTTLLSFPHFPTLRQDLEACFERAQHLGLEVLMVNTSRPDLLLNTVKVIVPGCANIWPQLGNPRLYHVPVDCGWFSTPLTESQLNPMGLFI